MASDTGIDQFHQHLEICKQCSTAPFDLCERGDRLLRSAVTCGEDPTARASARAKGDEFIELLREIFGERLRVIRMNTKQPEGPLETVHVPGLGAVGMIPKQELDAFQCGCGRTDCTGPLVSAVLPCGHKVDFVYSKAAGALVLWCQTCNRGNGFRLASS